jgi:hypothetical protein
MIAKIPAAFTSAAPRAPRGAVRCSAQSSRPQARVVRASPIPTPDEDREVAHTAFLDAFTAAQPECVRIRGMQEFASAILARARIPSQAYSDPLAHIFQEFDVDKDGSLSAAKVGRALRSRDVNITDEQVQMFIDSECGPQGHSAAARRRCCRPAAAPAAHTAALVSLPPASLQRWTSRIATG